MKIIHFISTKEHTLTGCMKWWKKTFNFLSYSFRWNCRLNQSLWCWKPKKNFTQVQQKQRKKTEIQIKWHRQFGADDYGFIDKTFARRIDFISLFFFWKNIFYVLVNKKTDFEKLGFSRTFFALYFAHEYKDRFIWILYLLN